MSSVRTLLLGLATMLVLVGCTDTPKAGFVGQPAPNLSVTDSDRSVSLKDLRGKVVLLNLWATWCAPCVEEIPSLVRLQKRMGDKVTILAISLDEDGDAYHRFLKQHQVDLLTVRDEKRISAEMFSPTGYPETYVIDRSGTIRRKFVGPQQWDSDEFIQYLNKL